ncbi:hypothetical protein NMG60_11030194 [Bertholletia excelsa]
MPLTILQGFCTPRVVQIFRKNFEHLFHSQHPLHLCLTPEHFVCQACGFGRIKYSQTSRPSHSYLCSLCSFGPQIECAQLLPIESDQDLESFTHPHPLLLCYVNPRNGHFPYKCSYCDFSIDGSICLCLQCNALLPKSCSELPLEMHSPFHPWHPLTLRRNYPDNDFIQCIVCLGFLRGVFSYQCQECRFGLHTRCAAFLPIKNNTGDGRDELQIVKFSRRHHPLLVFENHKLKISCCRRCVEEIKIGDSICFWAECKVWIHKTCAELPQKIKHVVHPIHPLTLIEIFDRNIFSNKGTCTVCGRHIIQIFLHQCSDCKLFVHVQCASSMTAAIKFRDHPHPLALFTSQNSNIRGACRKCCRPYEPPFFRCLECKYNLHVHCLQNYPLLSNPYIIAIPSLLPIPQLKITRRKMIMQSFIARNSKNEEAYVTRLIIVKNAIMLLIFVAS